MVKIEFYNKGKFVGRSDKLKEGSDQKDRDDIALDIGVREYDEFILDEGRTHCKRVTGYIWLDHKERAWETLTKKKPTVGTGSAFPLIK